MFESAVFYAFAAVLLVSATLVITSRNPVHSALFLCSPSSPRPAPGCCCAPSSSPSRWWWSTSAR